MILRQVLEDLLYESGVDLFLQAHVHHYERTTPVYKNETMLSEFDSLHVHKNPIAPVYITNGNAGNIEGHNDPLSSTLQNWVVFASEDYGYSKITVFNLTHLYYEQYSAPALKVIDYVWIIKDNLRY